MPYFPFSVLRHLRMWTFGEIDKWGSYFDLIYWQNSDNWPTKTPKTDGFYLWFMESKESTRWKLKCRSRWGHVCADPTTNENSNILNLNRKVLIIDLTPPHPNHHHGNKITPSTSPPHSTRENLLIRAWKLVIATLQTFP